MILRLAQSEDLDAMLAVVHSAQRFMAGNRLDQWQNGYPNREALAQDIQNGTAHVMEYHGEVHGIFTVIFGHEPCYDEIDGAWLTDGLSYATIHRGALDDTLRGKGVSKLLFAYCNGLAQGRGVQSLRADTHRDNLPMNTLLQKCGYRYCGVVLYPTEGERLAYEKLAK